ncbi:MAG: hypothetical protein U5L72_17920 [Bacteroidales bacterium]|nr:hypothetical protein [Bacteroidales bacterium]
MKSTFSGPMLCPAAYRDNRSGYVDLIVNEMIPAVAAEKLADYIDVFCDRGFFTVEETSRILAAGERVWHASEDARQRAGLFRRIQTGVRHRALSVDHLEFTGDEEITCSAGKRYDAHTAARRCLLPWYD